MIRTRPQETVVGGSGKYVLALNKEELQLISALTVMCRLGPGLYEEAAMSISEKIETVTGLADHGLEALMDVAPTFSVRDPLTLDVIAEYDEDYVVEINI